MAKPFKTSFEKNLEIILRTLSDARTMPEHDKDNHKRNAGMMLAVSRWLEERYGITAKAEMALIGPTYYQAEFMVLELEWTYINSAGTVSSDNIFKQYVEEKGLQFPQDVQIRNFPSDNKNEFVDNPYEREYYSHLVRLALEEVAKKRADSTAGPYKPCL